MRKQIISSSRRATGSMPRHRFLQITIFLAPRELLSIITEPHWWSPTHTGSAAVCLRGETTTASTTRSRRSNTVTHTAVVAEHASNKNKKWSNRATLRGMRETSEMAAAALDASASSGWRQLNCEYHLLIIHSSDRVFMQCSGSIYEPHWNIFTRGSMSRLQAPSYLIKLYEEETARKRSFFSKMHRNKEVPWSVAWRASIPGPH